MFSHFLLAVVCLGFVSAGPFARRAKRQLSVNCIDTFQNVPNPCINNPNNNIYFPHPSDPAKFIQCDLLGQMYIIQCPQGKLYNVASASCALPQAQVTTPRPVVTVPTRPPMTTAQPPQTGTGNPCTNENIAKGQIYFAYRPDKYRFIECDQLGNANVLHCPGNLVWEQSRLSCVYEIGSQPLKPVGTGTGTGTNTGTQTGTGTGSQTGTGSGATNTGLGLGNLSNPCTPQSVTTDDLFHPHPNPSMFIQCDLWGDANVMRCPTGLVWNDYSKTCASPYLIGAPPK